MLQQVDCLCQQRFQDAQQAFQLTLQDEPNLLVLLAWLPGHASPEQIVDTAGRIEKLSEYLGRPAALAAAVAARQTAAAHLSDWSHARFDAESYNIERQLASGDLPGAYRAATALQQQALAAGETAYPTAAYDIAMAHWLLGRVLKMGGQAHAALPPLAEAQCRFETLAAAGDSDAARMASVAITEQADCLTHLGRLDEAAAYEDGLQRAKDLDENRQVAVG